MELETERRDTSIIALVETYHEVKGHFPNNEKIKDESPLCVLMTTVLTPPPFFFAFLPKFVFASDACEYFEFRRT